MSKKRRKLGIVDLPKWAQRIIEKQDADIRLGLEQLARLRKAHSILLDGRDWFTIHGPPKEATKEGGTYELFFLSYNGAHPACSLSTGDILLIGRAKKNETVKSSGQRR